MSSTNEAMTGIIGRQPEDSHYDENLRELGFARMAERGLDATEAGPILSDEEVKRKADSWRQQSVQLISLCSKPLSALWER